MLGSWERLEDEQEEAEDHFFPAETVVANSMKVLLEMTIPAATGRSPFHHLVEGPADRPGIDFAGQRKIPTCS